MEINLNGKLALVTASSKGIGFGVAKVFANCNADVILLSRNEENLKIASKKIEEIGKKPFYVVADLTKREDLKNAIKSVKKIGSVDILFFSTGGPKPGYFMEMDINDWEYAINLLLYPAIYNKRIASIHD